MTLKHHLYSHFEKKLKSHSVGCSYHCLATVFVLSAEVSPLWLLFSICLLWSSHPGCFWHYLL